MKEKPILFSGPMVRAILNGTKSQTRRVIKPQPPNDVAAVFGGFSYGKPLHERPCPYGLPGDRLWVRESWRIGAWRDIAHKVAVDYLASRDLTKTPWIYLDEHDYRQARSRVLRALGQRGILPDQDGEYLWDCGQAPLPWRPSIHMPRWASRITLEVVGVHVERLQDISEEDAKAEGVELWNEGIPKDHWGYAVHQHNTSYRNYLWHGDSNASRSLVEEWHYQYSNYETARESFSSLWHSLSAKRGFGWDANPWVFVIEFKRVMEGE